MIAREKWQEWNKLIRARFKEGPQQREQLGTEKVSSKEMIEVISQCKRGDGMWKQKMKTWEARLEQDNREAIHRYIGFRLQRAKPRLRAPRRLWIEVVTNLPVEHRVIDRWKRMKIEVGPTYTMEEIYYKLRSC
jgi:hypothetical protein